MSELLRIDCLTVGFPAPGPAAGGVVPVLREVGFGVRRGECLGLVGESGSGKTLTALAVLGLLPPGARVLGGRIELAGGGDLLALGEARLRQLVGSRIAMVFQDASSALNPVLTLGFQIGESLRRHRGMSRRAARAEAERLLELVAMPDPRQRLGSYPHELSGGQRQRAMLAMALAGEPELLLADEPTTALDVTVQAQVLELLGELRRALGLTVLLITHDLGVVAGSCDRVVVMYAGEVVEEAAVEPLFRRPAHPYTRALLAACPRLGDGRRRRHAAGIPGRVPEPGDLPSGCAFRPRCAEAFAACARQHPPLKDLGGRASRCLLEEPAGERP